MNRFLRSIVLVVAALGAGVSSSGAAPACDMAAASPWITRWLQAWEFTSREILQLPDGPPPHIVFFDSACVYTTSDVTLPDVTPVDGPTLYGARLAWRAAAHHDSITFPNRSRAPLGLMSFTNSTRDTGPFFVMAAPSYWVQKGVVAPTDSGPTGVFLHEFAHTRQVRGFLHVIGPIDSAWAYPEELDDDAVQTHFHTDSAYVASYTAERDLLFRAAWAGPRDSVRALATQALARMKARHARWFTGDKAVFATLDDTFLSMEGAAQWAAAAWLADPTGGGMTKQAAVAKMLGRRRWWAQDESLGLFLVVDRLLPGWPRLVFHEPSMGAVALLERAVR